MKRLFYLLYVLLAGMSSTIYADNIPETVTSRPDKTQQKLIDRGYGMFIHFGMNTFIQAEWSEGKVPASTYNPSQPHKKICIGYYEKRSVGNRVCLQRTHGRLQSDSLSPSLSNKQTTSEST